MPAFNKRYNIYLVAFLLLSVTARVNAQELIFASAPVAKKILSSKDAFLSRMSPFDRASRMKTDHDVSEAQFVKFVASAAMEWNQSEREKVESAYREIQPALTRLSLPLPGKVYVIKTSGREEGNAAYTRGNAIILPLAILSSPGEEIQRLLAHELFHIASRENPNLARPLYGTIGFKYCGEVKLPAKLAPVKITNPDAPENDFCIGLKLGSNSVYAIPVLLSSAPRYDVSRGGEFFQYLQLLFLLVETPADGKVSKVLYDSNGPRLVGLRQVADFFEQVGENTDYIIHPEEILAENFALLVVGRQNVRSPEILSRIRQVLAKNSRLH